MKKILLSLIIGLALSFSANSVVAAASRDLSTPTGAAKCQVCEGISGQVGGTCNDNTSAINKIMKVVLQIISLIAGFAAVIMVMVAGVKYTASGGDTAKIASAKSTLIYALVGIVIVAVAQFLVHYILTKAGA